MNSALSGNSPFPRTPPPERTRLGSLLHSGIPALPFSGGQPIPPGYNLRGFVWSGCPSGRRASRAVGSPFRAKFPPEVRFFVAGNAVTVGNTSKLVLRPEPKQGIQAMQTAGWSRHPIEAGTVSADRPQPFLAWFCARVNSPTESPLAIYQPSRAIVPLPTKETRHV